MESTADINRAIDHSNYNLTHFDIAKILSKVFKKRYRYIGNSKWEYLDTDKSWKMDDKKRKLKSDIKITVSELFIQRSLHWSNLSDSLTDINEQIHTKMMADKLVRSSFKLQQDSFVSTVIRESQSFFDIHNVDD